MTSFSVLRWVGLAAGAVGALVAVVLIAAGGLTTGTDGERPAVSATHAPEVARDVARGSGSALGEPEETRILRAVEHDPESRLHGSEFGGGVVGDYVDPDGTLPLGAATGDFAVAEGAYQHPEHDLPLPDAREPVLDTGEYVDPEAAP